MMKRLLVLAALCSSAFASAQIGSPTNLSFRLGGAYPLHEFTRDATAELLIGIGADYYFDRPLLSGNGETYMSFDWMGRGLNGDKGNMFPICLNHRWYMSGEFENANRRYYFLGLGVAIVDVVSTKTVPAARIGAGAELGQHIFGELAFVVSDDASGARATSFGAYLGYRF